MDTDSELILRCHDDTRAFRDLMDRYDKRIYTFLVGLAGESQADDLFQEFWLRVFRFSGGYRPQGKASGWLFRIANNVAMDGLSRRRRAAGNVDIAELGESLPDASPTGLKWAEQEELRRRLAAALEALPLEQRQVFLMREYGGMTFRDIAEELDIPIGTALSRMNYAVAKLRISLEDFDA